MEEDHCSETPNININSAGEPAEVAFITALIKKILVPIAIPITCIFIHNFPSTSTSFNLSQQRNHTSASHENDPTGTGLTLLGDGGEYIRGRGSNPHNNHDFHDDDPVLLKCVICLYDVVKGEKYRVLGHCKHGFHVDCIGAWLDNNSTCPLCRSPVPYTCSYIKDEHRHHQALRHAILSCFLVFLDHLCTWFLNPLGFDDPAACLDPHYAL